jgi:hypothetical protein
LFPVHCEGRFFSVALAVASQSPKRPLPVRK